MTSFNPMRNLPEQPKTTPQDTLVVFGEVFQRGYVNGIIEEAERLGMKVIYSTVGRRDENNGLRPLTASEVDDKGQWPLINVPLEAGFDLAEWEDGSTLVEQLSKFKMSQWKDINIDLKKLETVILKSREGFNRRTSEFISELEKELPREGNIIFAHTMAGGIPRAKIVMPTMNRIFKGSGDRYQSSEEFVETNLGKVCLRSFDEVTAETFRSIIEATKTLRSQREAAGFTVGYTAFGYHGCDALVDESYVWQSYAPYLQGWAKIELEKIAEESFDKKVSASVFNAPEILTNSSSVFLGVEVCLYPLLSALKKEGLPSDHKIFKDCQNKLKDEFKISDVEAYVQDYLNSDTTQSLTNFETWPHHNKPDQMVKMKLASAELMAMHKDSKDLITSNLSEVVFKSCGSLMVHEIYNLQSPVWWVGHDIVAKWASQNL